MRLYLSSLLLRACVAALPMCMSALLSACGGGANPMPDAENPLSAPVAAVSTVNGVATFSGPRTNYTIVSTSTGWTVTDHVGADGTSNLPATTTALNFTDFVVNLGIGAKSQTISDSDLKSISELYVAFFNRVPDADGLSFWIDQFKNGMTLSQMCDQFYAAAVQFSSVTGYSAQMTNADFVGVIYKNVLGRTSVDAEGLQFWTTALATGAATRGTLVAAILSSAHSFKGDATWGWVADLLDNKYTVAKYFAVQQGLNYTSSNLSITNTVAIAAAVTPTGTSAAIAKIGVSDSSFSTIPATLITFYILDGPTKGIAYTCAPSGTQGVTNASGAVVCRSGDVATLTIPTSSGPINLGQVPVPALSGIGLPVTLLTNGFQVAEILQTLNHGTVANLDVTGVTMTPAMLAAVNAYIAGAGTLPAGQASDDQFLASIQAQAPGVTYATQVSGNGTTFRDNTVLPELQNMIVGLSATNPAPVVVNGGTKLTGTITIAGGGVIPIPGCPSANAQATGGGILNATVAGNIQQPGNYVVNWSSPGFIETVRVVIPSCGPGDPGLDQTQTITTPAFGGQSNINVTADFGRNDLFIAAPAGCTPIQGADVGASNPLITLTTTCTAAGLTITTTVKLVGGW